MPFLPTLLVLGALLQPAPSDDPKLIERYVAAADALASDNLAGARQTLEALAAGGPEDLRKLARSAAEGSDLDTVRAAFKPLSDAIVKRTLPAGYVVAACPMYKGGALWVQKDGAVRNPYYGSGMLGCGTIQKTERK